jgi:hypothetical protein
MNPRPPVTRTYSSPSLTGVNVSKPSVSLSGVGTSEKIRGEADGLLSECELEVILLGQV